MIHQIEARNLVLGYGDEVVLKDLSFHVDKGDYLVILGDNGAGKSTLLRALLGIREPLGGYLDKSGTAIGYLMQKSIVDDSFPASVLEVALSGCIRSLSKRFFYSKKEKDRALAMLERFSMEKKAQDPFTSLSGGEKQRVLLSRALLAGSDVLVLDEPQNSLDVKTRAFLYSLLDELNRGGLTVIMVTHDIHPAINSANNILYVAKKSIFMDKSEFFKTKEGLELLKEGGHDA